MAAGRILLSDLAIAGKLPRRVAKALIAEGKHTLWDLGHMTLRELRTHAALTGGAFLSPLLSSG